MRSKEKPKNVDIIQNYIDEQIERTKGDTTPTPYRLFNEKTEKIIPKVKELFGLFLNKEFKTAQPMLELANEQIGEIKNEETKKINEEFVALFDQDIKNGIGTEENQEGIEKDKI
ncbi:MAG: hypothetical protein V1686_02555 [Patescibacteria group bacterium]